MTLFTFFGIIIAIALGITGYNMLISALMRTDWYQRWIMSSYKKSVDTALETFKEDKTEEMEDTTKP